MNPTRVAVLVDGDNISASHSDDILAHARKLGRVDIARVYAGAHPSCDWLSAPAYRLIHAGKGKNAADVLLSIDTVELALTSDIGKYVVASSDGDFTHLAHRLRERGLHVLGLGEAKTPATFQLACSEFTLLQQAKRNGSKAAERRQDSLDCNIRSMIAHHSHEGRGMPIADLGRMMRAKHGTQISTYPERSWRAYLSKRANLYDLDPRGPDAMVRFRPAGFAALSL